MKVLHGAAAMAALASVSQAGVLVGVASFDQFSTQTLYAIDSATGAATAIGDTGVGDFIGLAWSGAALFGYTAGADLYTINVATGEATLAFDSFGIVPEGDLAFDPTGALWSVNAGVLGTIDQTTGAFVGVGSIGAAANDVSGLVFVPNPNGGQLIGYAHNGGNDDSIVSFDLGTGAASVLLSAGVNDASNLGGADYDADTGETFVVLNDSLYTLDLNSGLSLVGSTGVEGFSGLAVIPAPGVGALLGLGAAFASRRRRA